MAIVDHAALLALVGRGSGLTGVAAFAAGWSSWRAALTRRAVILRPLAFAPRAPTRFGLVPGVTPTSGQS
jgi:hypothetical protein